MLNLAGRLPGVSTVGLNGVTGSGSGLAPIFNEGSRLNTADRNIERLKDFDVDEVKKQAEKEILNPLIQ